MRLSSIVAAAFIVLLAGSAFAQEWVEFRSQEDRVTVTFPVQPTVTQTTYKSQFGADLPSRVYSAAQGQNRFSLTVVDYSRIEQILTEKAKSCPPGAETCRGGGGSTGAGYFKADFGGAIIYATFQFLQRDAKVTYLGWNNIDLVEGHMMYMTNNQDKSRTSAGIYMHDNRLYILEGTVPAGYPDPGFFQQSVGWLDENGNGIRYQTLYHHGFSAPPTGRGGRGQGPAAGAN
ncbi:MAG: hypothetical protein EXQ53_01220 [Acidobacteria bacterium]|nr:hypothetical protein [Acidobacteriota bacterium]